MKRTYICKKCKTIYENPQQKYCEKCGGNIVKQGSWAIRTLIASVVILVIVIATVIIGYSYEPSGSDLEPYFLGKTVNVYGEEILLDENNLMGINCNLGMDGIEVKKKDMFNRTMTCEVEVYTHLATFTTYYTVDIHFNGLMWKVEKIGTEPQTNLCWTIGTLKKEKYYDKSDNQGMYNIWCGEWIYDLVPDNEEWTDLIGNSYIIYEDCLGVEDELRTVHYRLEGVYEKEGEESKEWMMQFTIKSREEIDGSYRRYLDMELNSGAVNRFLHDW